MSTIPNDPESQGLSRGEVKIFNAARHAVLDLAKTFDTWMVVARGVELARKKANLLGSRSAFQRILEQQGIAEALGKTWDSQKSTANKLLAILDRLSDVERWRASLSQHDRIRWSAPTTMYKHCPIFQSAAARLDAEGEESEAEADDRKSSTKRTALDAMANDLDRVRKENVQLTIAASKRCDVDLLHSDIAEIKKWLQMRILPEHKARQLRDILNELYPLPLPKVPVTQPGASTEDDIGLH